VITLVKVEGTLDELRALFLEGVKQESRKQAKKAGSDVVRAGAKATKKRAKSAWQKYMGQKKNQIKFKSGPKKGRLDLSKMARAFKKSRRK
tara:strand:- start:100 stop:372 length:273 start_codon:yes stop_codon:yes gene_type:complete